MSASALAADLHVPLNRINGILSGQRNVTANAALRLARYLGASSNKSITYTFFQEPHFQ